MKKLNLLGLFALLLLLVTVSSCEKEDDDDHDHDHDGVGTVELNFDYVWGMSQAPFSLNTALTHPMNGEVLTFETMKFYISNIQLKNEDGTVWSETESYHLVDAASSSTISLANVPSGHYTELSYTVGVDSARNVGGAQTGALSPANNMFWSWNSGYIMIKAEGTEASLGSFAYHLGGFSGANNIVTSLSSDFNATHLVLNNDATKTINVSVNPARFWHTSGGLANVPDIHMPGANAVQAATDFIGSFQFVSVE